LVEKYEALNADCRSASISRAALEAEMSARGEEVAQAIAERPQLFSDTVLFISGEQLAQMQAVITAVENIVQLPGWQDSAGGQRLAARGVFYGYDFHLDAQGAHLIEINTNAGGAFLNAMLLQSQSGQTLPGRPAYEDELEQAILAMFREEWQLERGDAEMRTVAIVDEQPQEQYLFPEFLLARELFAQAGWQTVIADPHDLEARPDGLYTAGSKIDLVYNRLTDFSLEQYPALLEACHNGQVVVTPNPQGYVRYADKRNLVRLSDAPGLRAMGAQEQDVEVLQQGLPETRLIQTEQPEQWWPQRKQWFFKPATGYGAKAAYRGDKLTRRVFEEIVQQDYVAQRLAPPGERMVCREEGEAVPLKSDVRCYVYAGRIQLVAARLYQGQTTNFRTPGGGFAQVRVV